MTTIFAPPSNANKWQMGFNSAFKGLNTIIVVTWIKQYRHLEVVLSTDLRFHTNNFVLNIYVRRENRRWKGVETPYCKNVSSNEIISHLNKTCHGIKSFFSVRPVHFWAGRSKTTLLNLTASEIPRTAHSWRKRCVHSLFCISTH